MKTAYIRLSLLLFAFVLVSCRKDETLTTANTDHTFMSSTKAVGSSATWLPGDIIGISVYKSGADEIYRGFAHRRYQAFDNNLFTPFAEEDKIIYPLSNDVVDFIAYYPYKSGITDDLYEINLGNQTSLESIDFLYSNNAKGKNQYSADINLVFNHQLSKIVIDAVPGEGLTEDNLYGVSILLEGFYYRAMFDLSDGSLHPRGEKTSIEMNMNGYRGEAIVMSGAASNVRVTFKLSDTDIYESYLPDSVFLPGTAYRYSAKINKTGIEIYIANIADWQGTEDPQGTGTTTGTIYNVGDYFPNPHDAATAIGIVYWLSPGSDGRSGKMLSLDISEKAWSTNNTQIIDAASIINGTENTNRALIANPTLQNFPAFRWCADKGTGWYLPARYELHIVREQWGNNQAAINNAITAAGGEILLETDIYMTSSESKSNPASMAEWYSFASKEWLPNNKTTPQKVRAIKAF